MSVETSKRINVTFPTSVLEELRHSIPRRERNQFIVETVEKELRRIRLRKALRESAGAWSDEDHPDLMTTEDVNRYVRRLRETAMPRSWDEIADEAKQEE
jgi:type III secretory pathway component EscV